MSWTVQPSPPGWGGVGWGSTFVCATPDFRKAWPQQSHACHAHVGMCAALAPHARHQCGISACAPPPREQLAAKESAKAFINQDLKRTQRMVKDLR